MKLLISISLLFLAPLCSLAQTTKITNQQYKEDFNFFWNSLDEEYCYFNKKQTDWQKAKQIYTSMLDTVTTRDQFVAVVEKALYEIYDHHAVLNTNTNNSQRLVPSGTDTWAEYVNGKPVIIELRDGFGTANAGIKPGMEVIAINDVPVAIAVEKLLPRSLKTIDNESKNFALRLALAGNHVQPRKFTLLYKGKTTDFFPDKNGMQLENIQHPSKVSSKLIGNTGYIKIYDCLYDNDLIPVFDSVMQLMQNTSSLVIDLRETPSGGNTTVARAILGWFTNTEHFYQKHEYYAEEKAYGVKSSWKEIVSARKGKYYGKPLVILSNHWTGSIAEGITIGFDALERPKTKIIGTAMARLCGAVYTHEMPNTKIRFSFPAERLYHVNGLPREEYLPQLLVNLNTTSSSDIFIEKALEYFKTLN